MKFRNIVKGGLKMNKKNLTFVFAGFFMLALTSAAVLNYYGQKQVDMTIDSPVGLTGELSTQVSLLAGDGYELYLVEGENKLTEDVPVVFQFTLLKDGVELVDTSGFYLAYSDDIEYAYKEEYGNASNWEEAMVWMNDNLDWFDWYLTGAVEDYDASLVTNHGENSAHTVLDFNTPIPMSLSPGEFKAVVYLDVAVAVVPGEYTLSIDMKPVLA